MVPPKVLGMAIDPSVGASIAVLIVQLFQWLREGRQHKWQQDQAKADSAERLAVAKALQIKVEERTSATLSATQAGVKVLADKIDQNTEISTKAFNEANHVNNKLVAIGEARIAGKESDRANKLDKITEVVSDTNKVVHKIGDI